jgi:hypothetical protein
MLCNGNLDYISNEERLQFAMGPFKREKIGSYEYEVDTRVTETSNGKDVRNSTGNASVDSILDLYRLDGFTIGVV